MGKRDKIIGRIIQIVSALAVLNFLYQHDWKWATLAGIQLAWLTWDYQSSQHWWAKLVEETERLQRIERLAGKLEIR